MSATFQTTGRTDSFMNWSFANPSGRDDKDHPGDVAPAVPAHDEPIMAPPEQPHRPWLVPGGRGAL